MRLRARPSHPTSLCELMNALPDEWSKFPINTLLKFVDRRPRKYSLYILDLFGVRKFPAKSVHNFLVRIQHKSSYMKPQVSVSDEQGPAGHHRLWVLIWKKKQKEKVESNPLTSQEVGRCQQCLMNCAELQWETMSAQARKDT